MPSVGPDKRFAHNVAKIAMALACAVLCLPSVGATAARATPSQALSTVSPRSAVETLVARASQIGVTSFVTVLDRNNGATLAATSNASTQVASESLMKLFIATYYVKSYGGADRTPAQVKSRLEFMLRYSDDSTASALFTSSAIPTVAAWYGLGSTSNAWGNPGYWGAARVTAADMAKFLWRASQDPQVGPWLFEVLAGTAATGSGADAGFDQRFGLNALSGIHGGKQGWGCDSYWTRPSCAVHSVGFTDRYLVAILQLSNGYPDPMRSTATLTAQAVQASRIAPQEGEFIADSRTGAVFRIAGGAPVYVTDWAVFGGPKPTRVLMPDEFDALPRRPREGTFLRDVASQAVFQVVGGAPLYVTSWAPWGGTQPTIAVDGAAISRAGQGWPFSYLRFRPEPGTALRGMPSQRLFTAHADGHLVPTAKPGASVEMTINDETIARAGTGGPYDHLAAQPKPSAPTGVTLIPGDGRVTLAFGPPSATGGLSVNFYEYSLDGAQWEKVRGGVAASPVTLPGQSNGSRVRVWVRAVTDAGAGLPSQVVETMPQVAQVSEFVPIDPARVYDSRWPQTPTTEGLELGLLDSSDSDHEGRLIATRDARSAKNGSVLRVGAVPADAVAVAYNVTATGQTSSGYLSVSPGQLLTAPHASVVNWTEPRQTRANSGISAVDEEQRLRVHVGGAGATHFVVDVLGYYRPVTVPVSGSEGDRGAGTEVTYANTAPSGVFVPLRTPLRVYDGRWPASSGVEVGPLKAEDERSVSLREARASTDGAVLGVEALPPGALAAAVNTTVTETAGTGYLVVGPGDMATQPQGSTVNWHPGLTVANAATVKTAPDGTVRVWAGGSPDARASFIVDIVGYFVPASQLGPESDGGHFVPLPPVRAYDSRVGSNGGPLPGNPQTGGVGQARGVSVGLDAHLPAEATAVAYNLTVTGNSGTGFIEIAPGGSGSTGTSTTNWVASTTLAHGSISGVDSQRSINAFTGGRQSTHFIVDVSGYYVTSGGP